MTFGQFLSILKARWWLVLLVIAVATFGTLGINLLLPKEYRATASVVLDFKPDPISMALYGGMGSPAVMATQVDIIESDRVAQRVVRNLKLNENPQIRQQWQQETDGQGSIEAWLATVFQRNMEVQPSRESSVIAVSYRAADPRFAAGLANAFVQAYIDTALELRVDPARQYSAFFDTRSNEARDALEKAQTRVSTYQKANGIIATDERLDIENQRLNELSSQLTMVQAIGAESSSRQAQAQGGDGERMQEVLNSQLVVSLRAELARTEARLRELTTRLGDNHPQVLEARASAQEQRSRLEAEIRRVTGGVTVTNTINRQRTAEIRASLDAQRAAVLRMKAVRDEGMVLMRDVENAQRAYDAVLQRFTMTSLESQTTQSNVNVLTQAAAPLKPAAPRITLNTILAFIGGTLLAIGMAMALELRDRRIRNIDDVVTTLGLPVIGSMPKPGMKIPLANRPSLMQQRLMAPLPAPKVA